MIAYGAGREMQSHRCGARTPRRCPDAAGHRAHAQCGKLDPAYSQEVRGAQVDLYAEDVYGAALLIPFLVKYIRMYIIFEIPQWKNGSQKVTVPCVAIQWEERLSEGNCPMRAWPCSLHDALLRR
jgi:hypothetical protein